MIIWSKIDEKWIEKGTVLGTSFFIYLIGRKADIDSDGNKAGEIWAIALSEDGQYLASTSIDGRINVWDNLANRSKIREFETKSSFGMSIDLVCSLWFQATISLIKASPSHWMGDLQSQGTKTVGFIFSTMTQVVYFIPC